MSSSNLVAIRYIQETTYGAVPAGVKSSLIVQDLTYEALLAGAAGDEITITYTGGATAGAEVVTVSGNSISVQIENNVSTATQVRTAVLADVDAAALVNVTVSGTGSDPQTTAASTPLAGGSGDFKTARFTSEKYSGTPETTESAQIRTDRMSSGQVVTGLTVAGGHSFELAKETAIEDFMESAMFNTWASSSPVTANFTLNVSTNEFSRGSGSFVDEGVVVGDFLILSNFVSAGNNVPIQVLTVSALSITYAGPDGMSSVTESATYQIADKLEIGTTKKSLTIEKAFTDLTTKGIVYKGCLVSQMSLDIAYGELISGSFDTSGNDYDPADAANEFASYGHYITDAETTNTLNGSVDMPFLVSSTGGSFTDEDFCIQSLNLALNNNLSPQTCIGAAAPENYTPGTAQITVELSSYLKNENWDLLALKLSQDSFAIGFLVKNTDGWYGFYLPAVQVSFEDPASGGANQEVSMEMTGTAKVGSNGESALVIYRLPA